MGRIDPHRACCRRRGWKTSNLSGIGFPQPRGNPSICLLRTYYELGSRVLGPYLDLDIQQDQGDTRLVACTRERFPCQTAGWAAGYARAYKSLVMPHNRKYRIVDSGR